MSNALSESFSKYQPWMSCKDRVTQKSSFHAASSLFPGKDYLTDLHRFLTTEKSPLGAMGLAKSEFQVLHDNECTIADFYTLANEALSLIFEASPICEALWGELVTQVIPLDPVSAETKVRYLGSGISNHRFRGAIFTHPPTPDEFKVEELAINLIHELGHQALMVYQYADPIFVSAPSTPVYSAIRKVHRPLIMSFHALAALTFMCEFTRLAAQKFSGSRKKYFEKRLQEINFDFQLGLKAVDDIEFTAFGRRLVDEMKSVLHTARSA